MTTQQPQLITDEQLTKLLPPSYQHTENIDPATIKPLSGRVLVRDAHDDTKDARYASIVLPENHDRSERKRFGVVIAVGLGERWFVGKERGAWGALRCFGVQCGRCNGTGRITFDPRVYEMVAATKEQIASVGSETICPPCDACDGSGVGRVEMQTKPGDRVLYDRRRECQLEIGGVVYFLGMEEQMILGILED